MKKPPQYTAKAKIGIRRVLVRIYYENDGWYVYIDDHRWEGPFKLADTAADCAAFGPLRLPEDWGFEDAQETLGERGVSDRLSDWLKTPGK
jgi:hypothetical protein